MQDPDAPVAVTPAARLVLSHVAIAGFRGLSDLTIDLDPTVTYLVGENNAGKSSIMFAIATALGSRRPVTDDLRIGKDGTVAEEAVIDIYLAPPSADVFELTTRQRLLNVQRSPESGREVVGFRTVLRPSREGGSLTSARTFLQPDTAGAWVPVSAPLVAGRFLELTDVQQVDASRDLLEELGQRNSSWGRVLSDLSIPNHPDGADGTPHPGGRKALQADLEAIAVRLRTASPVLGQLEADLKRLQHAQGGASDIELRALPLRIDDLASTVNLMLRHRDEAKLPLRFHGLGSRSLAALLVFQTLGALRIGADLGLLPHLVTLLEEPEAHLHPQAICSLRGVIEAIPGQSVVSTHAPHLVAEVDPAKVRLIRRCEGEVVALAIPPMTAKKLNQFRRFVERPLGEIFFASLVVFGDGPTERATLPVLVERKLGTSPASLGVTFVDCESMDDPKLAKVVEALLALRIPYLLYADNDVSGKKALAQMKDAETGAALTFDSACVVKSGEAQMEQMLIDAGFEEEIVAVAAEAGVTVPDDETHLKFLARSKPWASEQVAQKAILAGKAVPEPALELAVKIKSALGITALGEG